MERKDQLGYSQKIIRLLLSSYIFRFRGSGYGTHYYQFISHVTLYGAKTLKQKEEEKNKNNYDNKRKLYKQNIN